MLVSHQQQGHSLRILDHLKKRRALGAVPKAIPADFIAKRSTCPILRFQTYAESLLVALLYCVSFGDRNTRTPFVCNALKIWEVRKIFWDRCGIFPVRNFPLRKKPRTESPPPPVCHPNIPRMWEWVGVATLWGAPKAQPNRLPVLVFMVGCGC